MTPSPPPETAPEATRDLVLAEPLRDLAREFTFDADNAVRDLGGPDRPEPPFDSEETGRVQGLRFAASRLSDTVDSLSRHSSAGEFVETVEHRVVGTGPSGFQHESYVDLRADYDDWSERPDWTDVRYESRTVRTWTSGWSPVPDDTGETQ